MEEEDEEEEEQQQEDEDEEVNPTKTCKIGASLKSKQC
jgi:hypothetical protein